MADVLRKLGRDDLAASRALSIEAFGEPPPGSPPWTTPPWPTPGRHVWGVVEDAGAGSGAGDRVLARVAAHEYHSWFGGLPVPTSGIASVAVAAEHRGRGLLQEVLARALAEAVERGEVVSTLYPTAPGIYRPFGYELVASLDTVEVPTAELAGVAPPVGVRTRRAEVADLPAVREVYATWAAAQNGPLTRTGPRFGDTDEEVLAAFTAISLAVGADEQVVGYAAWRRGSGYGPTAVLEVEDLLATSTDAYRALWRLVGSFASVTGRVRLTTSGLDPARLALPAATWDVTERHPYMLRLLDVPGALEARRLTLPGGGAASIGFAVAGDRLGVLDGDYRLTVGAEPAVCEATGSRDDVPVFSPHGIALAWSGAQSCANLRLLGHLTGPADHDRVLDALLGGHQLHVRDYF